MKKITQDDVADMGLAAVDKLVELGLVPDCTDTDDETEFEAQDAIREAITDVLSRLGYTFSEDGDDSTPEWRNAAYGALIESLVGKEPVRMQTEAFNSKGGNHYYIIINDETFYYDKDFEARDADYRKGSSMVVQFLTLNKIK